MDQPQKDISTSSHWHKRAGEREREREREKPGVTIIDSIFNAIHACNARLGGNEELRPEQAEGSKRPNHRLRMQPALKICGFPHDTKLCSSRRGGWGRVQMCCVVFCLMPCRRLMPPRPRQPEHSAWQPVSPTCARGQPCSWPSWRPFLPGEHAHEPSRPWHGGSTGRTRMLAVNEQ
jgi:hypothetical protein